MQQRFLLQILFLAQHISGITMPIIRSSRVLYSGCCLWYFVLWFSSCWSWGLCVRFAGCCSILQTGHITLSSTPDQQLENHSTKYHRQQPLYNTLELLMTGIVVPKTCWASNKFCNKNLCSKYYVHFTELHTHFGVASSLFTNIKWSHLCPKHPQQSWLATISCRSDAHFCLQWIPCTGNTEYYITDCISALKVLLYICDSPSCKGNLTDNNTSYFVWLLGQ